MTSPVDWASFAVLIGKDRYLLQNMDWLEEELGGYEDDYLIFDCPGTISSALRCQMLSFVYRSDRTIYTPSVHPEACSGAYTPWLTDMCCLSDRISVHGRQI